MEDPAEQEAYWRGLHDQQPFADKTRPYEDTLTPTGPATNRCSNMRARNTRISRMTSRSTTRRVVRSRLCPGTAPDRQ